mmetsp:Transcript_471/g.1417  ORF Transcript_471/g.1417 Transcript_471/m.1417 type:complete len:248 (-) Transcript_471:110-853(-)
MNTGSTQPNTSPNPAGLAISAIAHHRVVGTPRDLSPASSNLHKIPPETGQAASNASKLSKNKDSQGSTGGEPPSSSSLSAPSVISKSSALLSAAKNDEASTSGDGGNIPSDQQGDDAISKNDSIPAYIVTAMRPSPATIFTPRKRELHFLSGQFRRDVESWIRLDDSDSDDDDETDEEGEEDTPAATDASDAAQYTGSLHLEARRDSYRKSHEKGALVFACDLLASMNDDDIYDTDTETNIEDDTLQ